VLQRAIAPHSSYVDAALGTFEETLPQLESAAKRNTVFLYVDPYSVKGLRFDRMQRVFDQIRSSSSSVEVLMNFNVAIFMRWALAAVKRLEEIPSDDDIESLADDPRENIERDELTAIAGGDYWLGIATNRSLSFDEKLKCFLDEYVQRMLGSFRYVARFSVKQKYHHNVPKYILIFATRHRDGIRLMNDFMCQARRNFVNSEFNGAALFDLTPAEEEVDADEIREAIVEIVTESEHPVTRPEIQLSLFSRGYFTRIKESEVNSAIGELLKLKKLRSSSGSTRINDETTLSIDGDQCLQQELF